MNASAQAWFDDVPILFYINHRWWRSTRALVRRKPSVTLYVHRRYVPTNEQVTMAEGQYCIVKVELPLLGGGAGHNGLIQDYIRYDTY